VSEAALFCVRAAAGLLARCYPREFRRIADPNAIEIAEYHYARERRAAGPLRAAWRTIRLFLVDTLRTAPGWWFPRDPDAPNRRIALMRKTASIVGDLRQVGRTFVKAPIFSLVVVLTLALGISVSTVAFDALDRTVIRPLPYRNGDRMVLVAMREMKRDAFFSPTRDMLERWREGARTVERLETYIPTSGTLTGRGPAAVLDGVGISAGLPAMLGVTAVRGRTLGPADVAPDAPPAIMLSEQYWRRAYGGSDAAIGSTLQLSGRPAVIVGVWPAGARLSMRGKPPDFFRIVRPADELPRGSLAYVLALAAPGRTVGEIETELYSLSADLRPNDTASWMDFARPTAQAPYTLLGPAYVSGVWLVFAGAIILFIVAVVNVGHLLAARASTRRLELGVRLALGGSPLRLARLLFVEAAVFAVAGIAAGVALAALFERIVSATEPRMFADVAGAGLYGRALVFSASIAAIAAVLAAIAPVLVVRSADVRALLDRASSRTTSRRSLASRAMLTLQAALAVLLVTGAVLMLRSYTNLTTVDTGVAIDELASVSLSLPSSRFPTSEERRAFINRVRSEIESTPGVVRVTTSGMPILNASIFDGEPHLDGEEPAAERTGAVTSSDSGPLGYLETLGVRLVAGRFPREGDEKRVVLVSESFARRRNGSVVGRMLYLPHAKTPLEIIGVVADARSHGIANREQPVAIYTVWPESADTFVRFIMRTAVDPASVIASIRARMAQIDPNLPLRGVETGPDVVARQSASHRLVAMLLLALASMGVVLAMAGLYGRVSLEVAQRTREMGIRMALGATAADVRRVTWRSAFAPVAIGALVGCVAGIVTTPHLDALLFEVPARDPLSVGAGVLLVSTAALLATLPPARRASRVDPATTLRAE
jgi:predicted permease